MKNNNRSGFRNHSTEYEPMDLVQVAHWVVCTACALVTAICLLRCILSFSFALDDMRKFTGLGFSHPFHHYLVENQFPETAVFCLLFFSELMLYIFQYRRANQLSFGYGMTWYFAGMLILHCIIWGHANSIAARDIGTWARYYYDYANISWLPSVAYLVIYLLRIRDC